MKSKLKIHLLLVGHVMVGILMLAAIQQLKITSALKSAVIFSVFLLLNLLYAAVFKLRKDIADYWTIKKIPYFIAGIAAGLLLGLLPLIAASAVGIQYTYTLLLNELSAGSVFVTFLITSWEELWFRGILLNYSIKYLQPFNIAIVMGLLFMLLHLLNPEISLVKEGPMLFLAGTLLTALYFCYRNIWLPAGLHFGNNIFGSIVHTNIDSFSLFGSQGYIYTSVLLVATIYFLIRLKR